MEGFDLRFDKSIALLICCLFSSFAFAAEIEILKYRGVQYVSGGMTDVERKKMDNLALRFPMHMVLISTKVDGPISGVLVTVKDLAGNVVLTDESRGPLFFVDVIGGRYTVEATYNGQMLTETKDLTGRRSLRLRFEFTQ